MIDDMAKSHYISFIGTRYSALFGVTDFDPDVTLKKTKNSESYKVNKNGKKTTDLSKLWYVFEFNVLNLLILSLES